MLYLAAMENGFLEELQKIADARAKSADGTKEKKAFAEKMMPGTERYYSERMRSVLMGLAARVYTPEGV
jgi:hypothetical protein